MATGLPDPLSISAGGALLKSLLTLIEKLSQPRSGDLKQLSQFATTKFSEIEKTHALFLSVLTKLQKQVLALRKKAEGEVKSKKLLEHLEAALRSADNLRQRQSEIRRSAYEEAKVYAEQGLTNKSRITLSVPDEPIDRLRTFMRSYCEYFEMEGTYHHELRGALDAGRAVIDFALSRVQRSGGLDQTTERHLLDNLARLSEILDAGIDTLRRRWAPLTRDYHRTIHSLRENGCPFR